MKRTLMLLFPHRRAERLIDERIDAGRGEAALSMSDERWLDTHLAGCADCRAMQRTRQSMMNAFEEAPALAVSEGFAGRVLMAAKSRSHEVEETADTAPGWTRLAFGGLAAAAVAAVFAVAATNIGPSSGGVNVSGHGVEQVVRPHFIVRAPGVGAAQVRTRIAGIVADHEGRLESNGGHVLVHLPRAELISVMQDLARRGRFKVSKADAGEVGPDVETIVIRFELD